MIVERPEECAEYGLRHAAELAVDLVTRRLQLPVAVPEVGRIGHCRQFQNEDAPNFFVRK